MKHAIDIIQAEHRALAAVLAGLQALVDGIASGRFTADFELLAAMVDYVSAVPEQVHHPKEDGYLFPAVRRHSPAAAAVLDDLAAEHRAGPGRIADLARALAAYRQAGAAGLAAFRDAVHDYVDFQWQHMAKEESKVLPLARDAVPTEEWMAIDAAFAANDNPWEGAAGQYRQLFARIVNIAPAPIGVAEPRRPA